MKNKKSFTLMEILISAALFTTVAIMATMTITSVVNSRSKTSQLKNINITAQKVFNEIDKELRSGNANKQVYVCSFDYSGQLVGRDIPTIGTQGWWGTSTNDPPNDFIKEGLPYTTEVFGEQIGNRRIGNVLQVVELDQHTPDTDVGWHSQWEIDYPPNYTHITKITQYSVDFQVPINLSDPEQGPQLVKTVLNINDTMAGYYFPCRNLAVFEQRYNWQNIEVTDLLPDNIELSTTNLGDISTRYFIVEGCDDIRGTNDNWTTGGNRRAYPDVGGLPRSCLDTDTATDQSVYGPLIRIVLGLESGVASNQGARSTQSVFRTTFQTRKVY
ncbi:type II secretion system protein J [Patescibacteria group bacterium]